VKGFLSFLLLVIVGGGVTLYVAGRSKTRVVEAAAGVALAECAL
jgi:hypothetical protein